MLQGSEAGRACAGQTLEGLSKPSQLTPESMLPCFETNVVGVVRVTNAFLPLLEQSPAGRVVNVSSGRGSLTTLACVLGLDRLQRVLAGAQRGRPVQA